MRRLDSGLWCDPNVPKSGWTRAGILKLDANRTTCEMCLKESVRFLHRVTHPDFARVLGVGYICAARMTGDRDALERAALRNQEARRKNWARHKWESVGSNHSTNVGGFTITIVEKPDIVIRIEHRASQERHKSSKKYETLEQAKSTSFEALLWFETKLERGA